MSPLWVKGIKQRAGASGMIRRGFSGRAVVVHNMADTHATGKCPLWAVALRAVGRRAAFYAMFSK